MRALVRDILARRTPEPRAHFLASQVNRLEEALRVSFCAMSVQPSGCRSRRQHRARARSLSRFRRDRAGGPYRCVQIAQGNPPWLEAHIAKRSRPQMAPQSLEKIESAPGNGMAPKAPDPQDMVQSATAPLRLSPPPAKPVARSRRRRPAREDRIHAGNGMAPEGSSPQDLAPACCEPLVIPTAADPSGARRVNLRMTLNGVMAC